MTTRVHLVIRDPGLRRALALRLGGYFDLNTEAQMPEAGGQHVILTTNSDVPPDRCAEAASSGHAVVVLAAVPRPDEAVRYRNAGASDYLAMGLDSNALQRALERALARVAERDTG